MIIFAAIPLCVAAGTFVFYDRRYMMISTAVALLSCAVFFFSYERRRGSSADGKRASGVSREPQRIVVLAVMIALSVCGRFLFAPIPFFKPVAAIVMICGMELGCESGFVCGALSAFISNFFFMQGPWTPFQMFIWGVIGFFAGVLPLKKSRALLMLYGAVSGVLYSAFMDVWTTVWWDNTFVLSRYIAALAAAVPITAVYVVSNVVFLLLLAAPIGKKLERVRKKYGL